MENILWLFSKIWLQFVIGLIIIAALIILFDVPDFDSKKTNYACKGIDVPAEISKIYHESYCLCMAKDNKTHDDKQKVCQAHVEKNKTEHLDKMMSKPSKIQIELMGL